ncbi:MAG: hypothetical protein K1X49_05165 [Saprospiraceae bacterium]|jgi:hypothetical protein|nr:hypothetical protein [Saprospiraceae bacterium]
MYKFKLYYLFVFLTYIVEAQSSLPDSCKIAFGTNLSGLFDWGTEQPFVNMMKSCRNWYSKDDGGEFETGQIDKMSFRSDGYPTYIPQLLSGVSLPQYVATIWARIEGWKIGEYKVFFEGQGELDINVGVERFRRLDAHTYAFTLPTNINREIQLIIKKSLANDPIKDIRIIHSEYESTYKTHPFNPLWLSYLKPFKSLRFMDWGHTNFWGQKDDWTWNQNKLDWSGRAKLDDYTWTSFKGIPYEMMIMLMEELHVDGWVCIPHAASDDYIRNMAMFFKLSLSPERHLYIEYSNEIWNWIFGQTVWLDENLCKPSGTWPECYVPAIQNALDIWSSVYNGELRKITRVVGAFTGWYDVSERVANTMRQNSYDAVAPTFYFGLSEESDMRLDMLAEKATTSDIAREVRSNMNFEFDAISQIKSLTKRLGKQLVFYEGGNHITAHPFGVEPSYSQAIIDLHRDTAIYNLYNEWFSRIKTLQEGNEPLLCENFSFIADRSPRYGCWGLFESLYQDTVAIKPYKYQAVVRHQSKSCISTSTKNSFNVEWNCNYIANEKTLVVQSDKRSVFHIINLNGTNILLSQLTSGKNIITLPSLPPSIYYCYSSENRCKFIVD